MNGNWQLNWHLPAWHEGAEWAGPGHTLPQAPQFEASLVVSTHAAPQVVLVQSRVQAPFSQTWPEPQTFPQAPQFLGSELLSTQAPEHCS